MTTYQNIKLMQVRNIVVKVNIKRITNSFHFVRLKLYRNDKIKLVKLKESRDRNYTMPSFRFQANFHDCTEAQITNELK